MHVNLEEIGKEEEVLKMIKQCFIDISPSNSMNFEIILFKLILVKIDEIFNRLNPGKFAPGKKKIAHFQS